MGYLIRFVLLFVLALLAARAFWTLVAGIIQGASLPQGQRSDRPRVRGGRMVRDPICGTFVLPSDSLSLTDRDGTVRHFCSEKCRKEHAVRAGAR